MTKENDHAGLFGLGQANTAYQQYFKGQSYLHSLVGAENEIDVHVANVTFEPGCRNNWHIHHHGFQILLVTSGEGDVVTIHEGIKHWHGATKDHWMSHIAITKGTSEWLEPVSDEAYAALTEVE